MPKQHSTFIRLECYAREAPHRKNSRERKSSIAGVFGEMMRLEGCCPHIDEPKVPTVVFGDPDLVLTNIVDQAGHAVDKVDKHLKTTALVAAAGVVTYPVPRLDVESNLEERTKCAHWWRRTQGWLTKYFGDTLQLIVVHRDEEYFHAHFVVVPRIGPDRRLNIGQVHPGEQAQRAAQEAGESPRQQKRAYQTAMSAFIDCYYEDVMVEFGFARHGPGKFRVDRRGWRAIKAQTQFVADKTAALIEREEEINRAARETAMAQIAAAKAAFARHVETIRAEATQRIATLEARNHSLAAALASRDSVITELQTQLATLEQEVSHYRNAYRQAG